MKLYALAVCTALPFLAAMLASPAAAAPAPQRAVVLCRFTTSTYSYRDATDAQKLTDLVQARLVADQREDDVAWVERGDIDAALAEMQLTVLSPMDSATSLRLGQWLKADFLVKGILTPADRGLRQLRIEVIDLDHADVLDARSVALEGGSDGRLDLREANVNGTLSAIRAALSQAQTAQRTTNQQVLIAPLHLRNAEATSRLDFVADDARRRFQMRNRQQRRVRYLQFPRAHDAIEEANLLATGLVAFPAAWQHVADYYLWGEYREIDGQGRPFAEVEVEVTLDIWDGRGAVQRVTERARVANLSELVERLVERVEKSAASKNTSPASDDVRTRIAADIASAAADVQEWVVQTDGGDYSRPADNWLRLWGQSMRLLSVAAFFDPANERVRRELVIETTRDDLDFKTLPGNREFWRLGRRSAAWKAHCQQFGYDYEHVHMPRLKSRPGLADNRLFHSTALMTFVTSAADVLEAADAQRLPADGGPPTDVPPDVLNDWRAALAKEYVERVEFVVKAAPEKAGRFVHQMLRTTLSKVRDDALRVRAIQALWPLLMADRTFRARDYESAIKDTFARIGRPEVAVELLAEAVRRGRAAEGARGAMRTVPPAADPPPQEAALIAPLASAPVRTISLDDKFYIQRVTALEFAGDRVWIGVEGQFRTLRQGYALFTCNADGGDIQIYPRIDPSETHATAFAVDDDALWIATAGAGVSRLDLKSDSLHKFGNRDGLPSPNVYALANAGDTLYAGGGSEERGVLASLEPPASSWTQHKLLAQERGNSLVPTPHITELAASDRWIAAYAHYGGSMVQLLVRKAAGGEWIDAGQRLAAAHPEFSRTSRDWRPGISELLFADDELWILTQHGLLAFNAATNEPLFASQIPFELTAGVRDGDRLWIGAFVAGDLNVRRPSASADAYLLCFNLKSRQWERQIDIPHPGAVSAITLRAGRLWLALGGKGATIAVIDASALPEVSAPCP